VVPLELVNPRFYHVDTCLTVLNTGHILYYPPAFTDDSKALLEHEAGGKEWLIPAGKEDASNLAVNLVNVGHTVVIASCTPDLEARFNEIGQHVVRAPLTAFGMSGGAVFCLTLRLDHCSEATRTVASAREIETVF